MASGCGLRDCMVLLAIIDLSGNYVMTNTVFNLGPPEMEWISSLFLTGYGQRSRSSFFNTCIKKNFGFSPINVEIILNKKTRLNSHGLRLFPHLLVKFQNSFYACVVEGCSAALTIAREKQT